MTDKHKPCPFCGSNKLGPNYVWTNVECENCGAQGPYIDENMDWPIAFELWDKRVAPIIDLHPRPPEMYGDCIPQCLECFGFTYNWAGIGEEYCHQCRCKEPKWSVCYSDIQKAKEEKKTK